jgi:hypothetical protein
MQWTAPAGKLFVGRKLARRRLGHRSALRYSAHGPEASQRGSRSKHSFAIWFFAVWNVLAWLFAAYAIYHGQFNEGAGGGQFIGVVHADQEPVKFWLMVLSLPVFGAFMMTYFVVSALRAGRASRS